MNATACLTLASTITSPHQAWLAVGGGSSRRRGTPPSAEQVLELGGVDLLVPGLEAHSAEEDPARLVQHEISRRGGDAEQLLAHVLIVGDDRERGADFVGELQPELGAVGGFNRNDPEPAILVLLVEPLEVRILRTAGSSSGVPEVE